MLLHTVKHQPPHAHIPTGTALPQNQHIFVVQDILLDKGAQQPRQRQQQQLPEASIVKLLPRSQRNTTSSSGFVISTVPDELGEGLEQPNAGGAFAGIAGTGTALHSSAGSAAGSDDVDCTSVCEEGGAGGPAMQRQQQQRQLTSQSHHAAGVKRHIYDADSSSASDAEYSTPCVKGQARAGAYSTSSSHSSTSSSSGLADHAPAPGDRGPSCQQQLSFVGAFDHLEAAAVEAAAAAGDHDGGTCTSLQCFSGAADDCLAGSKGASGTASDHVVTWYSAVGGSVDFGSPEPASPCGEQSFKAALMLRTAARAAATAAAGGIPDAAAPAGKYVGLLHDEEKYADLAEQAAADTMRQEVSVASSSSSQQRNCSQQRRRWDRSSSQQQLQEQHQERQQQQQQESEQEVLEQEQELPQQHAAATADEDSEQQEELPRWWARPSWAAAGLGGYRYAMQSRQHLYAVSEEGTGMQQHHKHSEGAASMLVLGRDLAQLWDVPAVHFFCCWCCCNSTLNRWPTNGTNLCTLCSCQGSLV